MTAILPTGDLRPAPETLAGPVTQTRVIRSEWTKLRTLRSTWWTLAVSVALILGVGVLVSMNAAGDPHASGVATTVAQRSEIGVILAQLALGVLAVLLISGEYSTGMIRSSLAAVPKRLPVLWGKAIVYIMVIVPVSLAGSLGAFLLGQVAWRGRGRNAVSLSDPGVFRIVGGAALYLTVAGICALAIGALVRNVAAGITAVVGLFFVVPTVFNVLPGSISGLGRFLPSNAGAALCDLATSPRTLAAGPGFLLLVGYAVVLVVLAAGRIRRFDV